MMKKFTKKPSISELTLRERIGQTICPSMRKILRSDDIVEYIKNNQGISIDKVNEICDFCSQVDEEYLNQ